MAISIRRGIHSNRAVQMHNTGALCSHFRHLSIYEPNKFATSAEIPRRENIFRKISEKLSPRFEPHFDSLNLRTLNPTKLFTRYCFLTIIEVYNIEILGITQNTLYCIGIVFNKFTKLIIPSIKIITFF